MEIYLSLLQLFQLIHMVLALRLTGPKRLQFLTGLKKKADMETSACDYHQEVAQSLEHELGAQYFGKDDQAESKSMDSSRSAEEEDDEVVEPSCWWTLNDIAHRFTCKTILNQQELGAVNKETKRFLTEVLLKVTDDLFDEIRT